MLLIRSAILRASSARCRECAGPSYTNAAVGALIRLPRAHATAFTPTRSALARRLRSPPAEKASARNDWAGQAGTGNGAGNGACDLNGEAATNRSKELAYILWQTGFNKNCTIHLSHGESNRILNCGTEKA